MSHVAFGGARLPACRHVLAVLLALLLLALVAPAPARAEAHPIFPAASTSAARAEAVRTRTVSTLLTTAKALQGRPYRYGARGPRAFDCSGFTGWVMRRAGTTLPRTSAEQYAASTKIAKSQLKPGDLVFFRSGGHVYHVAIYAGHHRIWHARQPGQGVALTSISAHDWVAGRVL